MPTGYTYKIADGTETSLRQFALRCARGMGALITMRDDPQDAPIPDHLTPDTSYHDNGLAGADADLTRLRAMTDVETNAMAAAEYDAELDRWNQRQHDDKAKYDRYTRLMTELAPVNTFPEGLKKLMMEQLVESRKFDCTFPEAPKYDHRPTPTTGEQWRAHRIAKAAKDYDYHVEHIQQELDRTAERNAWLAQLHAALKDLPE